MRSRVTILLMAAALLLPFQKAASQNTDALGTFTPYSLFGIGDLQGSANASLMGMGGIGAGVRDQRFINYKNIASLTQRDTLSFMLDLGVYSKNIYLRDQNTKSAYNTANINNFVISFPIKDKTAMAFGVMPYSNVGYKFQTEEDDPTLVSKYGAIYYAKYGNGNINQLFLGGAFRVMDNISVGLKGIYYFGSQTSHSDVAFSDGSVRSVESGWKHSPHGFALEAAAQGTFTPMEGYEMTVGATYKMKNKLHGSVTRYIYMNDSELTDTVSFNKEAVNLTLPAAFSVGFSVRKGDRLMVGVDYERQDWSKTEFRNTPGVGFKPQTAQSIRTGIEFVPNRYDARYYYKRMTYRAGFHYDKSYVSLDGKSVNQMGLTLGLSFPVYRLHNSFNVAVDFGQRGSKTGNLVKENYINFIFSLNLHDLWFIKPKYQ